MQAYGGDRLRIREDGAAILSCRTAKPGWQARIPKTLTTPEHPGTAVEWDEEHWEVIGYEMTQSGVRYTLVRWPDSAAMRFVDRYSEEAEQERARAAQRASARAKGQTAATLLGFLTGHLPGAVQRELGSDLGVNPVRLTMISAIPPFVALGFCIVMTIGTRLPSNMAGNDTGVGRPFHVPLSVFAVLAYLGLDSLIRFFYAMTQGKPIGSVFGLIGYSIYYGLSRDRSRLIAPLTAERGLSIRTKALTSDEKLQSDVTLVEPLFSLLDVGDQQRVAQRFGIDYLKTAKTLAGIVLGFSFLGVITSIGSALQLHLTGLISLVVAGWLLIEQAWRLAKMPQGPAPSVLRFLVRPFLTRYLA